MPSILQEQGGRCLILLLLCLALRFPTLPIGKNRKDEARSLCWPDSFSFPE
jgi:hypothetical protein